MLQYSCNEKYNHCNMQSYHQLFHVSISTPFAMSPITATYPTSIDTKELMFNIDQSINFIQYTRDVAQECGHIESALNAILDMENLREQKQSLISIRERALIIAQMDQRIITVADEYFSARSISSIDNIAAFLESIPARQTILNLRNEILQKIDNMQKEVDKKLADNNVEVAIQYARLPLNIDVRLRF